MVWMKSEPEEEEAEQVGHFRACSAPVQVELVDDEVEHARLLCQLAFVFRQILTSKPSFGLSKMPSSASRIIMMLSME